MYEFLIPGYLTKVPKLISVALKNDAKERWTLLEGLYELSTDLENGLPKWKMMGGAHEIVSVNNMWYIRQDGSNQKFYTHDQPHANERLPDDSDYNWKMYDGSQWVETASGDVKIKGK